MPETQLLINAIEKLENSVKTLSGHANTITYDLQSQDFRIRKNEEVIKDLDKISERDADRIASLEKILLTNTAKLDVLVNELKELKESIKELKTQIKTEYVTKEQYAPIQRIVYAVAGFLLTGVVGALLNVILIK